MTVLRRDFDGGVRLNEEPLIHCWDDLLSAEACAQVIAAASPRMGRSQVSGAARGVVSGGRTSSRAWVKHAHDAGVFAAASRISAAIGLPLSHAEPLQVIHYAPGQEYRPHFDAYDLSTEKGRLYCARGGQRLVTALAYLSAVEEGGETAFPRLGLAVRPRRGRLLVFYNCLPGTTRCDPRTYHQGCAPVRGEKWAFNLWFHERPY